MAWARLLLQLNVPSQLKLNIFRLAKFGILYYLIEMQVNLLPLFAKVYLPRRLDFTIKVYLAWSNIDFCFQFVAIKSFIIFFQLCRYITYCLSRVALNSVRQSEIASIILNCEQNDC